MSVKHKIKTVLKSAIKTYTQLVGESRKIEFKENLGDNLVFATGFDKSGTTWLMNILDYHPEIICRGSGQIFNFYMEKTHFLADRGGYGALVNNVFDSRWFEMGGKVWFDRDSVIENARNFIAASFKRYDLNNSKFIGDKSTVQDVGLIRKVFPNSKIICMVRDGRDVAVSFAYHFKRGGKADKFNKDGSFSKEYITNVAKAWTAYSKHIRQNLTDKALQIVKYEDLLANPAKVISDIYRFVDVSNENGILKKIVEETSFESLSGGRLPGQEDQNSYFRKGIIGDWKNHFGSEEKQILKEIAGEELIKWGYESDLEW